MELLHKELTDRILKAFFGVCNALGRGFQEKVHQKFLLIEMKARGFQVEVRKKNTVFYKGFEVGEYYAAIVVNNLIIFELKAAEFIVKNIEMQLINYLRGTDMEVGLVLNFGQKPEFAKKVFEIIPRLGENAKHLSLEAVNTEPPSASYLHNSRSDLMHTRYNYLVHKFKLIRYNRKNWHADKTDAGSAV